MVAHSAALPAEGSLLVPESTEKIASVGPQTYDPKVIHRSRFGGTIALPSQDEIDGMSRDRRMSLGLDPSEWKKDDPEDIYGTRSAGASLSARPSPWALAGSLRRAALRAGPRGGLLSAPRRLGGAPAETWKTGGATP